MDLNGFGVCKVPAVFHLIDWFGATKPANISA